MKIWEKFRDIQLQKEEAGGSEGFNPEKIKDGWERFANTGICIYVNCLDCPFDNDEVTCKFSPTKLRAALNEEVEK